MKCWIGPDHHSVVKTVNGTSLNLASLRDINVRRCETAFHAVNDWTPSDWAVAFAGEAGETCNAVKKLKRVAEGTNTAKGPQNEADAIKAIAGEIADTIIYADLLAARLGINLSDAIVAKFNEVSDRMKCDIKIKAVAK